MQLGSHTELVHPKSHFDMALDYLHCYYRKVCWLRWLRLALRYDIARILCCCCLDEHQRLSRAHCIESRNASGHPKRSHLLCDGNHVPCYYLHDMPAVGVDLSPPL